MSTTTELIPVEIQTEIEKELTALVSGSSQIQRIDTAPQYENAAALTREVKRVGKRLDDQRKELVAPLNGQVKTINDWFREPAQRIAMLEGTLKTAIQDFLTAQERIRIEAQRKADEEARKQREAIEAQARIQREKEEAARKAEEDARKRASEAANEEERGRAMAEAEKARQRAENAAEKASSKEQIAEMVVAPVVTNVAPKPQGMATVTTYSAEITDKTAFVGYCLGSGQLNFLTVDQTALNRIMAATKGQMPIPGVKCIKTESIRMRAAA